MATDTPVKTLIVNKLTEAQYKSATKSPTEAYFTTDSPKVVTVNDFMTPITNTNKGATKTQIDALDSKIDIAGTSGKIIGSYWFGKTKSDSAVPAPTLPGQNYYDFTTNQVYKSTDGATWTLDGTNVPPSDIDAQIVISSKFWDITEQENQHGGKAWWSHTNSKWSYSPTIYEDKPAGGASLPLLTRLISDHKFNDVSYLDANTFSWQSGAVYKAVYEHLVSDVSSAPHIQLYGYHSNSASVADVYGTVDTGDIPPVSVYTKQDNDIFVPITLPGTISLEYSRETSLDTTGIIAEQNDFDGTSISYITAEDGHRICLPDQETAVSNLYAKTGEANFYILDTANSQFKLPRTQKRKLIRAVKNGDSWYNLYSDGWVEQGGVPTSTTSVTLPVPMANSDYWFIIRYRNNSSGTTQFYNFGHTPTTTGFSYNNASSPANQFVWQAEGYASDSVLANEPIEHEYYYVGNFKQTAVEQTAGLNAELFNAKADITAVPGLVMPDYANATVLIDPAASSIPTTEQSFVAPKNGVINVVLVGFNNVQSYLYINDVMMGQTSTNGNTNSNLLTGQYLVPAGATVRFKSGYANQVLGTQQAIFYPLVGA